MDDAIRAALDIGPDAGTAERTIDITTTGRRSGEPRRIETVFYRHGDDIYLSGIPAERPRAWLLNLEAEPHFTFHLKHGVVADLAATATVITDADERRPILAHFVSEFNARHAEGSQWGPQSVDAWVARAPLARVSFGDASPPAAGARPARKISS